MTHSTHSMRRKDRMITDFSTIKEIVNGNNAAFIAMTDEGKPYGVMLNYAPVFDGEVLRLIFHSASAGRKIDILKSNPDVAVFINDHNAMKIVNAGSDSSNWTTHYRSVSIEGTARFITEIDEKRSIAEKFMRHFTESEINIPSQVLDITSFFEVLAHSISGKQNPNEN